MLQQKRHLLMKLFKSSQSGASNESNQRTVCHSTRVPLIKSFKLSKIKLSLAGSWCQQVKPWISTSGNQRGEDDEETLPSFNLPVEQQRADKRRNRFPKCSFCHFRWTHLELKPNFLFLNPTCQL